MYLLDTETCLALLDGSSRQLVESLRGHDPSQVRLCSVSRAELLHAARLSDDVARHLALLQDFFSPFTCLPFDDRCADHYAQLRARSDGGPPSPPTLDLMVAATALANDLTLVTTVPARFAVVPGLPLEDWTGGAEEAE